MTDRHAGYIVTLEKNAREDDAQDIIRAIRMLRNVASVTPVVADAPLAIATERVRGAFRDKFYGFYLSTLEKD
jgi:hypothetical protein